MSEKAPMQSTPFVSSTGETRNPIYEGQFDGETPEQAEARRHWAKVAMEMARNAALSAPSHGEQVRKGWRLVPFEPNEAIRDAINLLCDDHSAFEDSDAFWSYLLAATPSAGSQEQE